MSTQRSPEYLRYILHAVKEFRDQFRDFMELHVVNDSFAVGVAPAVSPRDGADRTEISAAAERVDETAGRAHEASSITGLGMMVEGIGPVDPITAWRTMLQPMSVVTPSDVETLTGQIIGRLGAMIQQAELDRPPQVGAAAMHPLIWGTARGLWLNGHYREAVAAASEALNNQVKQLTARSDLGGVDLWRQVFSSDAPELGKPRMRWPGDPTDQDVKSMNSGLRELGVGVQQTIRNSAAHSLDALPEQEALERLAALSLLARWVEVCEVQPHADEPDR